MELKQGFNMWIFIILADIGKFFLLKQFVDTISYSSMDYLTKSMIQVDRNNSSDQHSGPHIGLLVYFKAHHLIFELKVIETMLIKKLLHKPQIILYVLLLMCRKVNFNDM